MTRENLSERLQRIKSKGFQIIFADFHELTEIPSEKLLNPEILIIRSNETFAEIQENVDKFEVSIERQEKTSIYNYLNSNS